jgi:hypothetical protein
MNMKHLPILTAVVVATLGVNSAHAIQKHDPIFQRTPAHTGIIDPDLARRVRYQNGSARRKPDLYVAAFAPGKDPDLVREIRYQNGSPRSKNDQQYMLTPLK